MYFKNEIIINFQEHQVEYELILNIFVNFEFRKFYF